MNKIRKLVEILLENLCNLVGHAGGCWVLNGPLRRVWAWAIKESWD